MEIEGLAGLDFTIPRIRTGNRSGMRRPARRRLYLRHFWWDHGRDARVDLADYSKKLLDYFGRKGLFIQTSTATPEDARALVPRLREALSR
jgi:hypothetical protein